MSVPSRFLHRFAISTVCVALVTVTMGALTTSKNAGMAFRDWPTSDGVGMFSYPWLNDFARDWDKFLEHGHRLAGALIGMWSIALVAFAFRLESRRWVRGLSVAILFGVICQGLLGGFRVQLDERGLAMLHGLFAAMVFSLMGTMVVVTGSTWNDPPSEKSKHPLSLLKVTSILIVGLLLLQYVLGGLIRHQGTGLHEHLGLGLLLLGAIFANFGLAGSAETSWLRTASTLLLLATVAQVALGGFAWVLRFGFPTLGYVAIADSIQQVTMRTAHTVWGIIVFMTAVVNVVKIYRVAAVSVFAEQPLQIRRADPALTMGGQS